MMDITRYEERRDELARCIDAALRLPHVYDEAREELQSIRRKLFESQFRLVLISGFECGKSTTFNALCDGMEISPRGALQRTSATVISAQNTDSPELCGKAEVVWRTDNEMASIFAKYLLPEFAELQKERFGAIAQAEEFAKIFRFEEDAELLERALRKRLERNRRNATLPNAEREALRMAWLLRRFYGDPRIAEYRRQAIFQAEEIGRMVCFPEKWNDDWILQYELPFELEDCLFLFIREARLYIQSERLRRTGSVLIDCPGLFASEYDSNVAFDILENADAIWYILPAKELGSEELECARGLFTAKPGKVFFTVNLNGNCSMHNLKERLIPTDTKILQGLQVPVQKEDFLPYHALLALLSVQAERMLEGKLDAHSREAIQSLARKSNPGEELPLEELMTNQSIVCLMSNYGYGPRQLAGFDLLRADRSGITLLHRVHGFDAILSRIEDFVVQRKAKAVLVEAGARKVIGVLAHVEKSLELAEEMASRDEAELTEQFENAREELEEFQTFCTKELRTLEDAQPDGLLARDYWERVIVSSIDEVARKASGAICRRGDVPRKGTEAQIINDVFADVVKPKATAWVNGIKQGTNTVFNREVMQRARGLQEKIEAGWKRLVGKQPLLGGLPVPMPVMEAEIVPHGFMETIVTQVPGVNQEILSGAASGLAIGMLVGSFIFPAIGTLMGGLVGGILGAFQGDYQGNEEHRKAMEKTIREELNRRIGRMGEGNADVQKLLRKQEFRMKAVRIGMANAFSDALEKTSQAFEERVARVRLRCQSQRQAGEEIARRNSRVRTAQIQPLREEVERFVAAVRKECGKEE